MASHQTQVLIVGGGLSGLRAADVLHRAGADFALLEARDRVGGRTVSQAVGCTTMDLGGQWLGPTQHRARALVRQLGLTLFPTHTEGEAVLDICGQISRYRGSIPRLPVLDLLQLELALRAVDHKAARVPQSNPGAARQAPKLDAHTVAAFKNHRVPSARVRGTFDAAVRVVFGAEPEEISLLWFLAYLNGTGGLRAVAETENGAQQDRIVESVGEISRRMAQPFAERVHQDWPVHGMDWGPDGVVAHGPHGSVRAQRAIVAMAPPLAGRLRWQPPLPVARDQLHQRMPMGATVKLIIEYERPFWRQAGLSGEAVSDRAPVSVVLDNCSHDGQVAALVVFVVGAAGRAWDGQPEPDRLNEVLAQLARWFGPEARRPKAVHAKDWQADPWSRGCPTASFVPAATVPWAPALRTPVGPIHWAGTESATEWAGYIEGALEAGDRSAAEVLARL